MGLITFFLLSTGLFAVCFRFKKLLFSKLSPHRKEAVVVGSATSIITFLLFLLLKYINVIPIKVI
jgi:hypothetical protein